MLRLVASVHGSSLPEDHQALLSIYEATARQFLQRGDSI